MTEQSKQGRYEILLPADQRRELDALARATGLSTAGLLRLGASWVLARREILTHGQSAEAA